MISPQIFHPAILYLVGKESLYVEAGVEMLSTGGDVKLGNSSRKCETKYFCCKDDNYLLKVCRNTIHSYIVSNGCQEQWFSS
jgi:hypothetical protein